MEMHEYLDLLTGQIRNTRAVLKAQKAGETMVDISGKDTSGGGSTGGGGNSGGSGEEEENPLG